MLAKKVRAIKARLGVISNRQGQEWGLLAVKAVFGGFGQRTVVLIASQRLQLI